MRSFSERTFDVIFLIFAVLSSILGWNLFDIRFEWKYDVFFKNFDLCHCRMSSEAVIHEGFLCFQPYPILQYEATGEVQKSTLWKK